MALKHCRECNWNVSTEAKICPNCGIKRPTKKSSWGQSTLIALAITVLFFMWIADGPEDRTLSKTSPDNSQISVTTSDKPVVTKEELKKPPTLLNSAEASELNYDENSARNAKILNQLVIEAQVCMSNGAKAALMTGERNSDAVVKFTTSTCGNALRYFMTDTLGHPKERVQAFLNAMAYKELNRLPGVSRVAP